MQLYTIVVTLHTLVCWFIHGLWLEVRLDVLSKLLSIQLWPHGHLNVHGERQTSSED